MLKLAAAIVMLSIGSAASAFDGVPVPSIPFTYPAKKVTTQHIEAPKPDFSGKPPPLPPGVTSTHMPPDNMPVVGLAPTCACPIKLMSGDAKIVATQIKPDAVPLQRWRDGRAVRLEVLIVGNNAPLSMLLDTGASASQISVKLADQLIAAGHAKATGTTSVLLADGSTRSTRMVTIDTVIVGQHAVHDVVATASASGDTILGFPVLDSIAPFTIDTRAGQLIFHAL